jgi:hypothetical protein
VKPTRNKGGKPQYKPTDADRATVEAMAAAGFRHEAIARCLGTDGIDDKTMRLHFRQELDVSADKSSAMVATQVYKAAMRGEGWACRYWLNCRAGWKERSIVAVENDGKGRLTLAELLTIMARATALSDD